jgi:hypothetical protein
MYNFVKGEVTNLTCKVHHHHPKVVKTGNSIKIECCCEAFRSEITDQLPAVIDAYIKQTISNAFKKR